MKKLSILLIILSIFSISLIAAKSNAVGKVRIIKGKAYYKAKIIPNFRDGFFIRY